MADKEYMKLKDKKISIWKEIPGGEDEDGFETESTYEKIHDGKLWAYYRQTSGEEFYSAMAMQYKEDAIFFINFRKDVTHRMVILYNHKVYSINRVDDYEGYTRETRISAYMNSREEPSDYPGMIDD